MNKPTIGTTTTEKKVNLDNFLRMIEVWNFNHPHWHINFEMRLKKKYKKHL